MQRVYSVVQTIRRGKRKIENTRQKEKDDNKTYMSIKQFVLLTIYFAMYDSKWRFSINFTCPFAI